MSGAKSVNAPRPTKISRGRTVYLRRPKFNQYPQETGGPKFASHLLRLNQESSAREIGQDQSYPDRKEFIGLEILDNSEIDEGEPHTNQQDMPQGKVGKAGLMES